MAQKFVKPAVEVEAMQFAGIANLHEILDWLGGIIYVMQGQDHELRMPSEYDDDMNFEVKSDAPPYGVIRTRSGYDRVDIADWIVMYDKERVSVYDPMDFALKFEELVET